MSRIHEALKKAELERTSYVAGRDAKEPGIVKRGGVISGIVDKWEAAPAELNAQAKKIDGSLTFEALASRCSHLQWRISPETDLFGAEKKSLGVEAFRTLRSRLLQVAKVKQLQRVLITSSAPGEGKTFVAANLAHSFARHADCRVLLIDADLRASRLHLALGAPNSPGLTDYLRGETDEFSVIQMDAQKRISFIPAGDAAGDAGELILGGRMKKLLDVLTPVFDWVILDSPPTLAVHDASVLADSCDGVVFVVKAGATSNEDAVKACAEFRQKNLLGVVLNQTESRDFHGNPYYYGGASSDQR